VRASGTLVCVSRALADRLRAPEALVQPMGIERDEAFGRSRIEARARTKLGGFTALSLSRLVAIKGIDAAIRGAARAGIGLVVAGDGPERPSLEALSRSLAADVRFVGHVEGEDRRLLLRAADVFVAPSRAIGSRVEGTPTSVLEALAAGLPIVGTRISGIAETVAADAGLLSDSSSSETLARDLSRLRDDPALHAALSHGARRASAAFDVARVADRFERLCGSADQSVFRNAANPL
jgi:glycosyltransferase involved in cell wall biosynthesis